MKKQILITLTILIVYGKGFTQSASDVAGAVAITAAITFVAIKTDKKTLAKEIAQFRSKEFIINEIIGPTNGKDIRFETESLASDNSAGLITIAFNCNEVNKRGLLLAFFGPNTDPNGNLMDAYGFKYIPLKEAQDLFKRIDEVKEKNKKYMSSDSDVNNVYIEHDDIKFVGYRDGGEQLRVFWNGFEVVWERAPFDRSKRRLNKWFE